MYVIRERLFRLGEDSDITDESGRIVLQVDGKVLSLHSRLILRDPGGREVAQVHRKLAALTPTYEITVDGKNVAEVRKHFFAAFHERFTIDTRDIYNGYWFFGRPTVEELRMDLRAILKQCHWDWDLSDPKVRAAWEQGETDRFYPPELGWPREVAMRGSGPR